MAELNNLTVHEAARLLALREISSRELTQSALDRIDRVGLVDRRHRLVDANDVLESFLAEATQLGDRLGPLLIQLPPSLSSSVDIAERFFAALRDRFDRRVALEPRHASWFGPAAERLLTQYQTS